MPTYDLKCRECGHTFERFVMRMLRAEDGVCPQCGSTQVDRGVGGGFLKVGGGESRRAATACGTSRFG